MTSTTTRPRVASESVQGRRPYNEDAVSTVSLDDGGVLLAVADGMGGHAAGEVASALAVEALREGVVAGTPLDDACRLANRRVHARARSEPGKQGMGTTLVAALVGEGTISVANVGDSRAYLITATGIRQLTHDHSFVAEAVRRGGNEAELKNSRWRDVLTRSIGTEAEVDVDLFGPVPLEKDAALLLCSDGLYKVLEDDRIHDVFLASADPADAARALVTAAYEGGSDDNITAVVAELGSVPRRSAPRAPTAPASAATVRMEPLTGPVPDETPGAAPSPAAAAPVGARPAGVLLAVAAALAAVALSAWLLLRG